MSSAYYYTHRRGHTHQNGGQGVNMALNECEMSRRGLGEWRDGGNRCVFIIEQMSALACSISGAPLTLGVVSSKTGHLYQKSTILHYLSLHGIPLSPSDLVELTPSPTQVVPAQQNIPSLVQKLQSQLDALVLETHLLKVSLRERREQLAAGLYRQDAAIRVIARLTEQRDQDRQRIAQLMQQIRDQETKQPL